MAILVTLFPLFNVFANSVAGQTIKSGHSGQRF